MSAQKQVLALQAWAQGGRVHWDIMSVCTTLIFATTRMMELLPASGNDLLPKDINIVRDMASGLNQLKRSLEIIKADMNAESHVDHMITPAESILRCSNELYARCYVKYGLDDTDLWKTSFLELQGTIQTAVRYLRSLETLI
jgi:hypothetical protein